MVWCWTVQELAQLRIDGENEENRILSELSDWLMRALRAITNINAILELADDQTLVILDKIGAGTDPSEGMGIGIAVLEYLNSKSGFILASTHFNEIKRFAEEYPDFINGSMAFDLVTLIALRGGSTMKFGHIGIKVIDIECSMHSWSY